MSAKDQLREALLAALGSPERVKAYLQWAQNQVALNQLLLPANLRRFRAQGGPTTAAAAEKTVLLHKGLYAKPYVCLFDRVTFQAIRVKGSFSRGETTVEGATGESRDLLYLVFSVQICPQCFFASGDTNHFAFDSADPNKVNFTPGDRQRQLMAEQFSLRAALATPCGSALVSESRTPKDALAAYQIAVLCAKALYEGDRRHDPLHLRAAARYQVSASQVCRVLDDNAGSADYRRQALATFQEAFSLLQGTDVYETLYSMVRLACDSDDAAAVQQCGMAARKLFDGRAQVGDPRERTALDKFLRKINVLYEEFFQRHGEDRHIMNL